VRRAFEAGLFSRPGADFQGRLSHTAISPEALAVILRSKLLNREKAWRMSWTASNVATYLYGNGSTSTTRPPADDAIIIDCADADYVAVNFTSTRVTGTLPASWIAAGGRISVYAVGAVGEMKPGVSDWEKDGSLAGGIGLGGIGIIMGHDAALGQEDSSVNNYMPTSTDGSSHGLNVLFGGPIFSNTQLMPLIGISRLAITLALQPATADSITAELDIFATAALVRI
jgi:hypothetical protein